MRMKWLDNAITGGLVSQLHCEAQKPAGDISILSAQAMFSPSPQDVPSSALRRL